MDASFSPTRAAVLAAILLCSGCIRHETTTYREEPRVPVAFENDAAARLFYETLQHTRSGSGRTESKTAVSLPVVLDHKHRVVQGESVAFNRAVRRCDLNADGLITEQEAGAFAKRK
jgi:hypothetical protein